MMTKTSEVQIFTFTGDPIKLGECIVLEMKKAGNRVIDILSATESMGSRLSGENFGIGIPSHNEEILHYTMLYRLT